MTSDLLYSDKHSSKLLILDREFSQMFVKLLDFIDCEESVDLVAVNLSIFSSITRVTWLSEELESLVDSTSFWYKFRTQWFDDESNFKVPVPLLALLSAFWWISSFGLWFRLRHHLDGFALGTWIRKKIIKSCRFEEFDFNLHSNLFDSSGRRLNYAQGQLVAVKIGKLA